MGYIYCITNQVNKKQYVGKCVCSIEKRFKTHKQDSKKSRNLNRPLYRAFNKYGINNFVINQLEEVKDLNILSEREIYWIKKLNTFKSGYNATSGGDGSILYDRNLVINTYKKLKNPYKVSKEIGCCIDTVYDILKQNNIKRLPIQYSGNYHEPISVCRLDPITLNVLQIYDSIADAAKWLLDNNYIKVLKSGVRTHISEACKNINYTRYKFKWKYL